MLDQRCGRTTKKGTACTLHVLSWWWLPGDLWNLERKKGFPQSCMAHLTPQERELYDRTRREADEREEAAQRSYERLAPACWAWPVPEDVEAWTPPPMEVGTGDHQVSAETAALLARTYASSPENRASALLAHWQQKRCALCGDRDYLVEDHDHHTGLVRGWLCRGCNVREGADRSGRGPIARYRERHPTLILGLRIRYWDPFLRDYAPDYSQREGGNR